MAGVPKAPPIKWTDVDRAMVKELVENTPLNLTGTMLKHVLDNPNVLTPDNLKTTLLR